MQNWKWFEGVAGDEAAILVVLGCEHGLLCTTCLGGWYPSDHWVTGRPESMNHSSCL
jgi:hypothetical protein